MNYIAAIPLCPRYKNNSHATFFWQVGFDSLSMGFLAGKTHAGPCVNTPLKHLKPVIFEPLAKVMGSLALGLCAHGEIKGNDQPAHFEFFNIHGL